MHLLERGKEVEDHRAGVAKQAAIESVLRAASDDPECSAARSIGIKLGISGPTVFPTAAMLGATHADAPTSVKPRYVRTDAPDAEDDVRDRFAGERRRSRKSSITPRAGGPKAKTRKATAATTRRAGSAEMASDPFAKAHTASRRGKEPAVIAATKGKGKATRAPAVETVDLCSPPAPRESPKSRANRLLRSPGNTSSDEDDRNDRTVAPLLLGNDDTLPPPPSAMWMDAPHAEDDDVAPPAPAATPSDVAPSPKGGAAPSPLVIDSPVVAKQPAVQQRVVGAPGAAQLQIADVHPPKWEAAYSAVSSAFVLIAPPVKGDDAWRAVVSSPPADLDAALDAIADAMPDLAHAGEEEIPAGQEDSLITLWKQHHIWIWKISMITKSDISTMIFQIEMTILFLFVRRS